MAVAKANVPPDLAREFEAMGEPVVTHRLTRFKDAHMRAAAHEWLAQQQAEREAVQRTAISRAGRRNRWIVAILAVAMVLGWAAAFALFFLR